MRSILLPLFAIMVMALLFPSGLHADRIAFHHFRFSIEIPDSGWSWDSSMVPGKSDGQGLIFKATNDKKNKRFGILLFPDSGGAAADYDALAYAFVARMVTDGKARMLDTSEVLAGGIRALRFTATLPDSTLPGGVLPVSMVVVMANEYGYILMTSYTADRPERDPELLRLIQYFSFIGSPDHFHLVAQPTQPSQRTLGLLGIAMIGAAIGIPTLLTTLWTVRKRRRREKQAEREWEAL